MMLEDSVEKISVSRSSAPKVRCVLRDCHSVIQLLTAAKDIDIKSARERFCGPGRAIPKNVIDNMDEEIRKAKASDNYVLKKQLKQR